MPVPRATGFWPSASASAAPTKGSACRTGPAVSARATGRARSACRWAPDVAVSAWCWAPPDPPAWPKACRSVTAWAGPTRRSASASAARWASSRADRTARRWVSGSASAPTRPVCSASAWASGGSTPGLWRGVGRAVGAWRSAPSRAGRGPAWASASRACRPTERGHVRRWGAWRRQRARRRRRRHRPPLPYVVRAAAVGPGVAPGRQGPEPAGRGRQGPGWRRGADLDSWVHLRGCGSAG